MRIEKTLVPLVLVILALALQPASSGLAVEEPVRVSTMATDSTIMFHQLRDLTLQTFMSTIHLLGSVVPLRGLASLAADLGLPGAKTLIDILTPPIRTAKKFPQRRIDVQAIVDDHNAEDEHEHPVAVEREDLFVLVGAALGKQDCALKAACLAGKKMSTLTGGATLTVLMSAASKSIPDRLSPYFNSLRESVMYSNNCDHFKCQH